MTVAALWLIGLFDAASLARAVAIPTGILRLDGHSILYCDDDGTRYRLPVDAVDDAHATTADFGLDAITWDLGKRVHCRPSGRPVATGGRAQAL